jgi:hypothetical protein
MLESLVASRGGNHTNEAETRIYKFKTWFDVKFLMLVEG